MAHGSCERWMPPRAPAHSVPRDDPTSGVAKEGEDMFMHPDIHMWLQEQRVASWPRSPRGSQTAIGWSSREEPSRSGMTACRSVRSSRPYVHSSSAAAEPLREGRRLARPRRFARRPVRAHGSRARGPRARRRRLHEPAHRGDPVHQFQHGWCPRVEHAGQARCPVAHRGRPRSPFARVWTGRRCRSPQSRSRLRRAALTRSSRLLPTPTSARAVLDASRASDSE